MTSPFGTARVLNGEVESRHLGTDFAGAVGAPVRAANAGVVALAGHFYLAGNVVYVDHGEGLVTGYFHLSRVEVAQGDTVTRGQIIGRVGRSGRVTGPHLHWIARYGRITVDPMSLLRAIVCLALLGASVDAFAAKKLVFKDTEVIEGEAQKPDVLVFITKQNLNDDYQLDLKQSFLNNIVEAAKHAPF